MSLGTLGFGLVAGSPDSFWIAESGAQAVIQRSGPNVFTIKKGGKRCEPFFVAENEEVIVDVTVVAEDFVSPDKEFDWRVQLSDGTQLNDYPSQTASTPWTGQISISPNTNYYLLCFGTNATPAKHVMWRSQTVLRDPMGLDGPDLLVTVTGAVLMVSSAGAGVTRLVMLH